MLAIETLYSTIIKKHSFTCNEEVVVYSNTQISSFASYRNRFGKESELGGEDLDQWWANISGQGPHQ